MFMPPFILDSSLKDFNFNAVQLFKLTVKYEMFFCVFSEPSSSNNSSNFPLG